MLQYTNRSLTAPLNPLPQELKKRGEALRLGALCVLARFASWRALRLGALCVLVRCASWRALRLGALCVLARPQCPPCSCLLCNLLLTTRCIQSVATNGYIRRVHPASAQHPLALEMFKLVMEYMGDSPKGERGGGKVRRCISF